MDSGSENGSETKVETHDLSAEPGDTRLPDESEAADIVHSKPSSVKCKVASRGSQDHSECSLRSQSIGLTIAGNPGIINGIEKNGNEKNDSNKDDSRKKKRS